MNINTQTLYTNTEFPSTNIGQNNINTQKYFYQNNNDNINGRYFDRNDYIHNNDLSGNSFRNPNNNQIVKYNSFKHQIINNYPKSQNVLELLKVVPNQH